MADLFRMARITDDQPTMSSSEVTGVNASSFFGQSSVTLNPSTDALRQGANHRLSSISQIFRPHTSANTTPVQKFNQTLKNSFSPHHDSDERM
jgi:hypothetical protein